MSQQSTLNSSSTPLGAGRAFLGVYEEVLLFGSINVQIKASTACDVVLYQTSDRLSDSTETIPYHPTDGLVSFSRPVTGSFFKVVVRNLGVAQTLFSIQTIYKAQSVQPAGTVSKQLYSASIGINGVTPALYNLQNYHIVSIYGSVSGATNLTLQLSLDGVTYFDTQYVYSIASAGGYGYALTLPFQYFRIKSSSAVTAIVNVTVM
jgi:hypothetical protein